VTEHIMRISKENRQCEDSSRLIGVDIETYSPSTPPWKTYADPIVCVSFAITNDIDINDGLCVISMIQPPEQERLLLSQSLSILESLNGVRVWFYGYGEGRFDAPYMLARAAIYGLENRLKNAIESELNLDVYDVAKKIAGINSFSMRRCEEMLDIKRILSKSCINGANYHYYYDLWRRNGSYEALFYNIEDAITTLRVFQKLKWFLRRK